MKTEALITMILILLILFAGDFYFIFKALKKNKKNPKE
jgi:preprotein translocase subunit YajC